MREVHPLGVGKYVNLFIQCYLSYSIDFLHWNTFQTMTAMFASTSPKRPLYYAVFYPLIYLASVTLIYSDRI